MTLIQWYYDFLVYLRIHKDRSPRTVEQYSFHLWRFMRFLNPRSILFKKYTHKVFLDFSKLSSIDMRKLVREMSEDYTVLLDDITLDDIKSWRVSLLDHNISPKTMNAHMITLRSWFKYLKKEGYNTIDPTSIDLMQEKDREVTFLTSDEVKQLFLSIDRESIQGKRDFAIIWCIYATWLRISELTSLNRSDIREESDQVGISIRGKWSKLRMVYLTNEAKSVIIEYINARSDYFSPLFIRHNFDITNISSHDLSDENVRLSRFFITNMIKDRALRANIAKDISAHTLRHSFATTLLGNGADIRIIQELLWHASITTTQVYTHVTNARLAEAHKLFHHD